jgi:hypothetical protein
VLGDVLTCSRANQFADVEIPEWDWHDHGPSQTKPQIAAACGYRETFTCADGTAFARALKHCFQVSGPTFITCKINRQMTEPLPRVTSAYSPEENLRRVQAAISAVRSLPAVAQVEIAG